MTIIYNDEDFMTVKQVAQEVGWPLEYTTTKGLVPYINRIRSEDLKGIEIGTGRGEGSYLLLEKCSKLNKLYTIDPFKEYMDWVGIIEQKYQEKFEEIAKTNLSEFGSRAELVKKSSDDAVSMFEDNGMDFIFIDGDHSAEQVKKDCDNYYPKLKVGGIFAVHDTNLNMVREGLKRFRDEKKVRIPIQLIGPSISFWYKV
jgi:predicted O-methyltransferase YrrM